MLCVAKFNVAIHRNKELIKKKGRGCTPAYVDMCLCVLVGQPVALDLLIRVMRRHDLNKKHGKDKYKDK